MGKNYEWKYSSVGGVNRIEIKSGEDIAHLGDLDQKLWTVLSCPVAGLEFDEATLKLIDTDNDGKIRAVEVIAAADWLTSVVKDKDLILKGESAIKLDQIDTENEEGRKLYDSAKQILANLGLEKDEIGVADTSDSVAIFAKTRFNGDGIITPASSDDDVLKQTITTIVEKIGSAADRSGEAGVGAEQIEAFYAACADYSAWQAAAAADKAGVFPYGDNTAAALAACDAVKDKIADYFMRCKLIAFNADVAAAVDVSVEKIAAISDRNLATRSEELGQYPIARPTGECVLSYDGINPAWKAAFDAVKALVLDVDFAGANGITEEQWLAVLAKFGPYSAWMGAKKGDAVESLGLEAVDALLAGNTKAALLDLVEKDKALADEAAGIDAVNKLTHLYRDFFKLLNNYITMAEFYKRDQKALAVFEAGRLFVDGRCCELCIRVSDMGNHADMAELSHMFLLYCTCTSKVKAATMDIVAVLTAGSVSDLRPGKNGIFYDRDGQDWDATVVKVVENPINVRNAFWSPYRKLAKFISDKMDKSAADKDSAATSGLLAKADGQPGADGKPAFDIAKFAGIFAAIGLAVGAIGVAVAKIADSLRGLAWWKYVVIIAAIMLVISGPACFIAWRKLRKRNLGPVLNANGWAVNSAIRVNIPFGSTLTSVARYPKVTSGRKHSGLWWILGIIIILIVGLAVFLLLR